MRTVVESRRKDRGTHRRLARRSAFVSLVTLTCLGLPPALLHHEVHAQVVRAQAPTLQQVAGELGYAQGGQPASRRSLRPSSPPERLPAEVASAIAKMVKTVNGCTHTVVGDITITAAHCHPLGFSVDGDVAWLGPKPSWVDPSLVGAGSTIYAVGYPRDAPGPQSFALKALRIYSVPMEGRPIDVLMAFGDGVACTAGASGMIGWVTIDNMMMPIGPMSVYATNPAITGLPLGQYVCGFAV